jgi:hypothetical protein
MSNYGSISNYCPIDGNPCCCCVNCAVLAEKTQWPQNWLREITGKWPGDETIEEILAALKSMGAKTP